MSNQAYRFSSGTLGLFILLDTPAATPIVLTLGISLTGLVLFGGLILRSRTRLSTGLVVVCTPVVTWLSSLYRDQPYDRAFVATAVDQYWQRIVDFRETPRLLLLIAVGGLLEQFLTATALWVALTGLGVDSVFLPILIVIPLPQVANVIPIPGSLGAYDVLLGGALVAVTGVPTAVATATVLLFGRSHSRLALLLEGSVWGIYVDGGQEAIYGEYRSLQCW